MTDREVVSIMGACERLSVSRRTIYNWLTAGKIEYCRTPGGSVRIYVDSLYKPADTPTNYNRGQHGR